MSKLHFVTFSLFLVIESTRSLPPSVSRRQFTGLDSKTDRFVSPVFPKETTPDSVDRMSEKCLKAFSGLDAFSVFQYIDAIGKPPSGLTAGNVLWLGSYDVCKNISDAQYCLAFGVDYEITAMQSLPISWGLCAPLACNETDIPLFVNELIEVFLPTLRIKWGKYSSLHCAHPSKWTTGPIITLVICGIIAYLCLVGTLVDLCLIQQTWKFWFTLENVRNESHLPSKERQDWGDANNEYTPLVHSNVPDSKSELVSDVHLIQPSVQERGFFVRFLLCFSITRNTSKIMDCSVPPGAITSVNGVRVLSLWWIILGHTYTAIVTSGILNDILLGLNIVHRFTFGTISNAFFAVDSFFVLSGLLVAYLSFRRMEQNDGKLPLFKFYFHRFWRLTPSYMFVILFYSNLYAFLGEGPYWFSSQNSTLCEKYWWTNLLYINNFYPTNSGNQCLGWSWYLANDMQFYIISPLVIFLVKRFKWKGVFASVGGLLGISFVVTAVIIDYYELKVMLFGRGGGEPHLKQNGAENNFSDLLYIKPYCRISPYLVGMVLGYLIHAEESAHRLSPLVSRQRPILDRF
ncbi:nose resistant to fluoxetine protein 6-like [Montipora capricornis]|uniref:nose resistant to fluoxetine protein 6-like n=1 Tax=Montipora capricornis TaxID=246305 RepID=UPI0035F14579